MTSELTSEKGYMILGAVGKEHETGKDPQTDLKEFIEYIRPYLDIEIISESSTKNEYKSDIQFNKCLIKKLCKNQGLAQKQSESVKFLSFLDQCVLEVKGVCFPIIMHRLNPKTLSIYFISFAKIVDCRGYNHCFHIFFPPMSAQYSS